MRHDSELRSRRENVVEICLVFAPEASVVLAVVLGDYKLFDILFAEHGEYWFQVTVERLSTEDVHSDNAKNEHYEASYHHETGD